jgi:heat shock protein HslJ
MATALLGFVGVALSSCHGIGKVAADPLDGTSWLLASLEERAPLPGVEITAVFDTGSVQGSSGCNNFSGAYRINGGRIEIREIQSTLMACPVPDGAMDQEQEFLALLSTSDSYQLGDGQLRLMHSGRVLLEFTPQD